jgi:uncharacterized RDD family membrane protein YckC
MQFLKQTKSRTPESIELSFTLAGVGNRTLALVIDYILWMLAVAITLAVFAFLYNSLSGIPGIQNWLVALQLLISFIVYVGYFVFFETFWQGQTPGKRYVKIRVIREDGRNAGLTQAIMRSLLRVVDEYTLVGFFMIIFTKQEKRLGDLLAGTLVVQEGQTVSPKSIDIEPAAQELADRLMGTGQISNLTPDDFAVIRRYLQRYPFLSPAAKYEVQTSLAREIQQITQIDRSQVPADHHLFIQAIYLLSLQQFGK